MIPTPHSSHACVRCYRRAQPPAVAKRHVPLLWSPGSVPTFYLNVLLHRSKPFSLKPGAEIALEPGLLRSSLRKQGGGGGRLRAARRG